MSHQLHLVLLQLRVCLTQTITVSVDFTQLCLQCGDELSLSGGREGGGGWAAECKRRQCIHTVTNV